MNLDQKVKEMSEDKEDRTQKTEDETRECWYCRMVKPASEFPPLVDDNKRDFCLDCIRSTDA